MGRRKIEIKAIKDDRNRSVTFLKRKGGLFKKAHELSVLCQVDVAVIIFGHNKKLYEFSSGDINETIGRFQYYGGAHEHKGPEDFMGKQDGDEDEDVDEPMEHMNSHSPPDQPMMAHHLQHQPAFQHMRHPTPSASPPIPNGNQFQRGASPMPHGISRPNSAMHVRRTSSNLVPQQHHAASHPPPQGNYAYMPNPPIYNPQAAAGMQMRGPPGPPQPPQQAPQVQPPPQYPYNQPPPHPQMQHVMQQEQRRQSMPPQYPPHERPTSVPVPSPPQPPPHQLPPQQQQRHQRQPSQPPQQQPQQQQQQHQQQQNFQSPPMPQPKPLPAAAKSHSIFTPIDDSRSLLAQHWNSTSTAEPPRSEPAFMQEGPPRAQTIDTASISRAQINGRSPQPPHHAQLPPQPSQVNRTNSVPSIPGINPPSRTNSMQTDAKRPRLKVQIPSEQSDGGEETANSSSKDTTAGAPQPAPVKGEPGNASGVVLPPPSPSASALLSAGATGPPNPFARPAPPVNNGSFGNRSDMETPISALPSRFVSDNLLPSPSSYYPEWYGRDTNILPSPLTFQTPVVTNGPSFRDDSDDRKRKSSDGSENGPGKRLKS